MLDVERARDERPNIILMMVDDMGFSDIDRYGWELYDMVADRMAPVNLREANRSRRHITPQAEAMIAAYDAWAAARKVRPWPVERT